MLAPDDHFKTFAANLEKEIAKYGQIKNFDQKQKQQVEGLIALERKFRDTLIKHPWGRGVYRDFVTYICDIRRNILAARPYFRERQGVFTDHISTALKVRDEKALYRFAFNFQFLVFCMAVRNWRENRCGKPIVKLFEAIRTLRAEIVEMNMPLAISRARVFYSRTPPGRLSYMDFIQIAAEGLMAGIDKYSPANGIFSKAFRSTVIGRMTGNFIEEYSETVLHFYPLDKKKIYRANKAMGKRAGAVDYEALAVKVNEGTKIEQRTNAVELAELVAAASTVSADSAIPSDPESPEPIERFAAPESTRPDVQVEEVDMLQCMAKAIKKLTVLERKLLRLKGIRF